MASLSQVGSSTMFALPLVAGVALPAATPSDAAAPKPELPRGNAAPQLRNPGSQQVAKEQTLDLQTVASE